MMVDNAERELVVVVGEERKEDVERSAVRKTLVGAIFNLLGRRAVRVEPFGVYRSYVFESPVRFERSTNNGRRCVPSEIFLVGRVWSMIAIV
jgi:hypothetical protein